MNAGSSSAWKQLQSCWKDKIAPQLDQITSSSVFKDCQSWLQNVTNKQEQVQIGGKTYVIIDKLGEGGYSFVYLVKAAPLGPDQPLGPSYALKKVLADGETLAAAQAEVSLIKSFNHINLLPLLDSSVSRLPPGTAGGASHVVYMLFPLYEGGNLWDYVDHRLKTSPLSVDEIYSLSLQLCQGLEHMHQQNIMHWDVKPHNLLLNTTSNNSNQQAVLIDFGSARESPIMVSNRQQAVGIQEEAERHSTAPYRPPELWDVASNCTIDCKVDVWAVGCVVYFMMVGESPFERIVNEAGGSLMLAVVNGNISWPQQVVTRYPQGLRDIVTACLNVDVNQRPTITACKNMILEEMQKQGTM